MLTNGAALLLLALKGHVWWHYGLAMAVANVAGSLIGTRVARRSADSCNFPYGRHRATSIAHLTAALALFMMGGFLLFEAAMKEIEEGEPTEMTLNLARGADEPPLGDRKRRAPFRARSLQPH